MTFNVVPFVLQGVGGALSAGSEAVQDATVGVDVSKAGPIFRTITLAGFITLFSDYRFTLRWFYKKSRLRTDHAPRRMIAQLCASTVLILADAHSAYMN